MKLLYAAEFKKRFQKLPQEIQDIYRRQETILRNDWRDPRLHIKKLKGHPFAFSFRITRNYRALFIFADSETILLTTIGNRKDVYR